MKAILILNAGSSSLKFALFPLAPRLADAPRLSGQVEGIGAEPLMHAKDTHSGERFTEALPIAPGTDQNTQHRNALEFVFDWIRRHSPGVDIVAAGHRNKLLVGLAALGHGADPQPCASCRARTARCAAPLSHAAALASPCGAAGMALAAPGQGT